MFLTWIFPERHGGVSPVFPECLFLLPTAGLFQSLFHKLPDGNGPLMVYFKQVWAVA